MKKMRWSAYLLVGFSMAIFACDPEVVDPTSKNPTEEDPKEEEEDLVAPEISLELSGAPELLHNEVTLTVKGREEDVIEKVEFFVNNNSVDEDIEAPYEFVWNTKDGEDGNYILKAVAHNASVSGEAVQEVTVKNTLMIVNVPNQYNQPRRDAEVRETWMFLSDENGNVLGEPQKAEDGTRLTFYRPADFNSEEFYLNTLGSSSYYNDFSEGDYTSLSLTTYPNFPLEELNLESIPLPDDAIGKAEIKVNNEFDWSTVYDYKTRLKNSSNMKSTNTNSVTYSVDMNTETARGFSTYETSWWPDKVVNREKYYRLDDIKVGNSYEWHTDDYIAMKPEVISVPFSYSYMLIFKYGTFGDDNQRYTLDGLYLMNGIEEFTFFNADLFETRGYEFMGDIENKYVYVNRKGETPSTLTLPEYSASLKDDVNGFEVYSIQGGFDIGSANWMYSEINGNDRYNVYREIYFPNQSGVSYAKPKIPNELLEIYPKLNEEMEFRSTYLLGNNELNSYNDMIKLWHTDEFSDEKYEYANSLTLYPESDSGARMLRESDDRDIKEKLEEQRLRTMGKSLFY